MRLAEGTTNTLKTTANSGNPYGLKLEDNASVTIGSTGSLTLGGAQGGIEGARSASVTINGGTITNGNISGDALTITGNPFLVASSVSNKGNLTR